MRRGRLILFVLVLLFGAGAWLFWRHGGPARPQAKITAPVTAPHRAATPAPRVSRSGVINTNPAQISLADWNTNKFAGRLSNTTKPIGQLVPDRHAILLANALIDTTKPLNFVFPKNLQSQGDPGAYIVQANGPIDNAFRAMLAQAGATVVAYIPNDAYLVRASANVANRLEANPLTQAVIPYEPYYKIQPSLLYPAVNQVRLADGEALNLGLFANNAPATVRQIKKLGGQVIGNDQSPFGPVVRVIPPKNWTVLATLPGVQIVEPFYSRAAANDLSRATVGVAADSLTSSNYLGLTGSNILVEVNDTGIDANHPDLKTGTTASALYGKSLGVIGDAPQSLVDTNGHGTHVAGIIAGDGEESATVTNAPGSILPGGSATNYQFRGMAPGANLYSVGGIEGGSDTNVITDQYLQEAPALTNALISNNSWVYEGDSTYDLAAASYDAAVRDALPTVTGSQPVLFVFAAGNAGNGDDNSTDAGNGVADSIESPATAKDVITVGALQENRNITNSVTNADGTLSTPWQAETSTSYHVAGFSSRGNTGIGIEGTYGRFKPDVVAPGTFIISDRSEQWDIGSYFYQNPTNDQSQYFSGYVVQPGKLVSRPFPPVPTNAVQLRITTYPNADSPFSYAVLPTLIGLVGTPGYQYLSTANPVIIPGANLPSLQQILNTQGAVGAFNYALSNNTDNQVIFNLETDIISTNGSGNYFLVLSNLDQSIGTNNPSSTGPGPYYRYETGTSMAAADVSGVLALIQEFYQNAYGVPPSPAMLKAMLISGAQVSDSSYYDYDPHDPINYEGWGLVNLPDSLPPGITNQLDVPCTAYVQDQSPTNALATGDNQTFHVSLTNSLPLRVTLAWTDPPGDPATAIKLVNSLELVVTNLSDPTNPIVYYGNDIPAGKTDNSPNSTNAAPVFDSINNVQTVNLQPGTGTNFSVTVLGYRVNVNAVTAQTNTYALNGPPGTYAPNVVQDYALVISSGNGAISNAMTVTTTSGTSASYVSNPTGDQQVTYLSSLTTVSNAVNATSYQALLNQFVGANSPLLGTKSLLFSTNAPEGFGAGLGPTNWQVTVGMTNQWHFYVVTNVNSYSNAAFILFNPNAPAPDTLSVPRMGVYQTSVGNATRVADIDLYVSTDPGLTNLDPNVISNCVMGTQVGAPPGGPFKGASLGRGTTEFVVDTNSQDRISSPSVYYIGVKSEDQQSAEYGFISIFSQMPFSTRNANGVQTVYGVPVPINIPDGSPAIPGKSYVFGLAIYPETVGMVTVADEITHQNFGDLIGTLTLNGGHADVLNNHDSFDNPNAPNPYPYTLIYDDSAGGGIPGSRPSDGPGSLIGYMGQQGLGVWMLNEVDDSLTQTGMVNSFTTTIYPHQNINNTVGTFSVPPGGWIYDYIDVPPGSTQLTIYGTNITATADPPVELFDKFGSEPTTNSFDKKAVLNPHGAITNGPPLESGRYYIGLYDPDTTHSNQIVTLYAHITGAPPSQKIDNSTDTPRPIPDDAVTNDSIYVTNYAIISSLDVALAVQHPRISDLVFHLISPNGTRDLLMENRGGTDPDGAGGITTVTTNIVLTNDFGIMAADPYYANMTLPGTGWTVTTNQVSVATDPATAYGGDNNYLALANGILYTNLPTTPGVTYILKLAYRGPDAISYWPADGTTADLIGGNNGTLVGGAGYGPGYVGNVPLIDRSFSFNGVNGSVNDKVSLGDPANLELTNALTIVAWVYARGYPLSIMDQAQIFFRGDNRPCLDPYSLCMMPNGDLRMHVEADPNTTCGFNVDSGNPIPLNTWTLVSGSYDSRSGLVSIYINGTLVGQQVSPQQPFGPLNPNDSPGVAIGNLAQTYAIYYQAFNGYIDDLTVYGRALSDSEINAIYQHKTAGKVDLAAPSIAQGLGVAQININGATNTIFGDNINWQTQAIAFTATGSQTPVQIQGVEPGMLLGNVSVVAVTTNYSYLVFTENTNLTTTPIKFAVPPFLPTTPVTNVAASGFESPVATNYAAGRTIIDGSNVWSVLSNQVTVMADPDTADAGNQFLALANGTISNTLPTLAGRTYVLTFRYRGPGIVGWWRGESNYFDSSGFGNNPAVQSITFTNGEVGSAFGYNGSSSYLVAPPSPSLTVSNLTFEGWIFPTDGTTAMPIMEYGGSNMNVSVDFWVNGSGLTGTPGSLFADARTPGYGDLAGVTTGGIVPPNQWSHVAVTVNTTAGTLTIYDNGNPVVVLTSSGVLDPQTSGQSLYLGYRDIHSLDVFQGRRFAGALDEMSVYNRALSDSELKAIYDDGTNGKFAAGVANPQSLAEAQVSLNGGTPTTLFGNNTAWQTKTIIFTATQDGTPLQITGLEPGMLLDSFNLAQTANDINYLPEEPLDAFDGENAHGPWTLEIQDDRAGATNPPPLLLSWQLRFNFVTLGTNTYPALPLTLPQLPEQVAIANQLFTVTNAAFGGTPPYTYALTSSVPFAPFPAIDTNGIITWTPTTNQAPAVYTFTNLVGDTTGLTATDIFRVLVIPTNGLPAFPGAEGPGGTAIGGRGGDVYHVINLNDGGPGSLRYGITNTTGNRTIVFDVSGTINLTTNLVITDPYLTIAGQTAPGDGITLKGFTTSVQDTHDDVLRFLRFRPGDINSPAFQGDSFHFLGVTNSIVDHLSASWSINEALSTADSTNVSVQWSIIADPLNHSAHYLDSGAAGFQANGYGSSVRYGSGAVSYHHDLYADNYSYNPRPGDNIRLDFINNVVFNWGIFAGLSENDAVDNPNGYTNFLNYIGNYFIAGSNTIADPNIAFQANVPSAANTQIYQSTNYIDNDAYTNLLNGVNTGWGMFNGTFTQLGAATPMPGIPIIATNPPQAYEQVLAFAGDTVAGASARGTDLLRDRVDTNIVTGVRDKSGQIIDFISSNRFSGVYINTNSEATYSGFTGAGTYWQTQGVSNFVGVNPWPVLDSAPQPLDSDGDGIPDYWEITFAALGQASMNPAVPNNNHLNPDGYTDLEHYINWLAAPHALTVSNTPVDVNLYAIVGRTGDWGFGVTNATNGTVTLDTNGYTATFTPTNGFFGFASFAFNATNLVTSNHFEVPVSVMVSITNITYSSTPLTNAVPVTNSVPTNSIVYYLITVPTNAYFATNRLLFASGPVNLLFSGVGFPTGTNIGDYTLLAGSTGGSSVLSITSAPPNIVQGGTYYLGVQNTGTTPVNFSVEVDFGFLSTNIISGPTITTTNINGTNGFLLQWSGPTNYQYTIQWTTNLAAPILWSTVLNPVINVTYSGTNGDYSWFDDGSLTDGFGPQKFYRVLGTLLAGPITTNSPTATNVVVAGTITPLTVAAPANATGATNLLVSATGPVNVWFNQTGPPTGNTNAGDVLMLSNVTSGSFVLSGSSTPPLAPGANYYLGLQNPGTNDVTTIFQVNFGYAGLSNVTTISSITFTNSSGTNGLLLTWFAPTNYQFQVQWTTNLATPWQTIPGVILTNLPSFTPTNGIGEFQYFDDGTWTGGFGPTKFYRLIAYPPGTPIPASLVISNAAIVGGAVRFQWQAPTNYLYQVLWTTNLALPLTNWSILTNPVLGLSNSVYTFTDTNQTGSATSPKFFRVQELP